MFTKEIRFFGQILHFTMAYPNFKNGPENGLGPLGVKIQHSMEKTNYLWRGCLWAPYKL
jgi:hypothetical protein